MGPLPLTRSAQARQHPPVFRVAGTANAATHGQTFGDLGPAGAGSRCLARYAATRLGVTRRSAGIFHASQGAWRARPELDEGTYCGQGVS
jgi:hypothetical protein